MQYAGFKYSPQVDYSKPQVCVFGKALTFPKERPSLCCGKGRVKITELPCESELFRSLYEGSHEHSKHFQRNIRAYNSCFAMTSFGANIKRQQGYSPSFCVQGQVYHRIGSALPERNENPQFLQIYFVKSFDEQASYRQKAISGTKLSLIKKSKKI